MEIVSGSYLFTANPSDPIAGGALAIDQKVIQAVGTREELIRQFPNATHQHFDEGVLMPGLINAHCHIARTGFYERYAIETDTPLSPVAWFLEGLHYLTLTPPETLAKKIEQSLKHAIQIGTTTLGAMAYYEGTYPLLKNCGLRGVVFHEILSGPNKKAQERFEVALALLEKYGGEKLSLMKMGFAPHSAYTLSRNLLNIISRHAKDHHLPLQIHLAESFAEMEFFYDSKGPIAEQLFPAIGWEELPPAHHKTPVQHLSDIGFFATPATLVGGLQLSTHDFPLLRRHLTKVVFCPSGNRRLKLGSLPWSKLKECGIPVALGTEVFADSEGFNLWHEMKLALREGSTPPPTAEEILRMATLGGARALGLDAVTGSLEVGKEADYLVVNIATEQNESAESICQKIIAQGGPSQIRRVAVAGKAL